MSCVRQKTCRLRSASVRRSIAPPPPPQRAPPPAPPPEGPAACCLFPCRETGSAASRRPVRPSRWRSLPSTHAASRRPRRGRGQNTRAPFPAAPAAPTPPQWCRLLFSVPAQHSSARPPQQHGVYALILLSRTTLPQKVNCLVKNVLNSPGSASTSVIIWVSRSFALVAGSLRISR